MPKGDRMMGMGRNAWHALRWWVGSYGVCGWFGGCGVGDLWQNILTAAESVHKQAEEAGVAAAKVGAAAAELVEKMDTVSAVIEENTAATTTMAGNSNELTQAIENIASVSEQNSASIEEISASTEEVSAQVEEVSSSAVSMMTLAKGLQRVVSQFKLK